MENITMSSREILQGYLNGDAEKLGYYLHLLSTCKKAFEVADRVVKPIYLNENIAYETLSKSAFYAPIASLATDSKGKQIKPKTLYYHISANQSKWKKERESKAQILQESESYVNTRIEHHAEGGYDAYIHIHDNKIPEEIEKLFQSYINLGYVSLQHKITKQFNARSEASFWELRCPLLLLADALCMLKEHFGEITLTYKSRFTTQENISIDEAIEIIEEESYDEQ